MLIYPDEEKKEQNIVCFVLLCRLIRNRVYIFPRECIFIGDQIQEEIAKLIKY